ncbi:Oxidoreductase [Tilletia horrida]|uniref:Mitochondrial intermembrane space import and assembly protein 40 n=1 Tax=Tilletia horrida TaxID=155126 RepID=A0AAN6GTM9_9BASI|nr:Oxidoreductase [Tilletia horrida]KAK0567541.1 Oxidoreductase [Tilletia horrida]
MLVAGTRLIRPSLARASVLSGPSASTARPTARLLSSSTRQATSSRAATASSAFPTGAAVALTAGVATAAALVITGTSLGPSRLQLESRPSYGERLKAGSRKSAPKNDQDAGQTEASKSAPKSQGNAASAEDAAQGTGDFVSSLSETQGAPEAAEVIVEGSETSSNQSAYNPDTGEINWDCPCLGGMAHGSCGEEFKAAFSCFVYSEQEPKGIDCVDRFKAMQDCFRKHPAEYAEEIADDERAAAEDEAEEIAKDEGKPANKDS